jgi:hypothetical protein
MKVIRCTYHCCHSWMKAWRKKPWFGDYSDKCKKCGRMVWYTTMTEWNQ